MTTQIPPTSRNPITIYGSGDSSKLIGKFKQENEVDEKVHNMMCILLRKGFEKYEEINNTNLYIPKEDLKDFVDLQSFINENSLNVYGVENLFTTLSKLTLEGLRNMIDAAGDMNGDMRNGDVIINTQYYLMYILYYKALRLCKSSKISTFKIEKQATTKGNSTGEIVGIGAPVNFKQYKKSALTNAATRNNIIIGYNPESWNSHIGNSASNIIFFNNANVLDSLIKYSVISLSDINALFTPCLYYGPNQFIYCKYTKDKQSIKLLKLPTTAQERTKIKEDNAYIKDARNKLYSKIGKTDQNGTQVLDNDLSVISSISSL